MPKVTLLTAAEPGFRCRSVGDQSSHLSQDCVLTTLAAGSILLRDG